MVLCIKAESPKLCRCPNTCRPDCTFSLFLSSAYQHACIQKQGPSFLQHPHVMAVTPPSQEEQCDIFMPFSDWWKLSLSFSVLTCFPIQDTVFMMAANLQKPLFVIDQVYFDLDSMHGLSLGLVGPCSVHFTQLSLNPVRGIGFARSGIGLGFMIWNHISFSFTESLGE